jgi:hypothetical protein
VSSVERGLHGLIFLSGRTGRGGVRDLAPMAEVVCPKRVEMREVREWSRAGGF